jgi:hypothetical protein
MFETFFDDLPLQAEGEHVRITCGYEAQGKDQAECLQRAWGQQEGIEIEIVAASKRPNIPRLVGVKVTLSKGQITREYVNNLLRKMVRVGEVCGCPPTSFGSET